MGLQRLIKLAQRRARLTEPEAKEAIIMLVEAAAARLDDSERKSFAAHLPETLQDIVFSVYPSPGNDRYDLVAQFMYYQNVGKVRAQQRIDAAWRAISATLSSSEASLIKSRLANQSLVH